MEFRTVVKEIELNPDELVLRDGRFVRIVKLNFKIGDTITDGIAVITVCGIDESGIHTEYIYSIEKRDVRIGSFTMNINTGDWNLLTNTTNIASKLLQYRYVVTKSGSLISTMNKERIMGCTSFNNVPNGKVLAVMNNGTREILTYDSDEKLFHFDDGSIVDETAIKCWYELAHKFK